MKKMKKKKKKKKKKKEKRRAKKGLRTKEGTSVIDFPIELLFLSLSLSHSLSFSLSLSFHVGRGVRAKNKYPRRHRVGGKGNQKKRNRLEEEKTENKTKQMQFAAFQRCPPIDDPMLRNRNPGSPTDNGRRRWEMNESMNQWKNKVRRRSRAILVSWMAPVGVFLFCSVFFCFVLFFCDDRPTMGTFE